MAHINLDKPQASLSTSSPEDLADAATDKAVDDITTKEADELLAAQDAEVAAAFKPPQKPVGLVAWLKHAFSAWWNNPKARWGTLAGLAIVALLAGIIPTSRYFVLNTVGVRSTASMAVFDTSTRQPLKNVQVSLANQTAKTNDEGVVYLSRVKLGRTRLVIEQRAFAAVSKEVTVGWGSNPMGNIDLTPTGTQYNFVVTDFMSGKPIGKAEAESGEAAAVANDQGEITLTIEAGADITTATVKAPGYRDEAVELGSEVPLTQEVHMVPARKHTFISKRSGKFDVYAIDVDGKNQTLLLAGSGSERDDMVLAPQPNGDMVAVVSTRDNIRNRDGYLLSRLSVINSQTGEMINVAQSEKIQLIDWQDNRLVFVQVAAGASAANSKRQRLMSFDYKTGDTKELASSNSFSDVVAAQGAIYYAPSEASQTGIGVFKIAADGTSRQTLLGKQVWNIFRTAYTTLNLSAGSDWYTYKIGEAQASKVSGPPADLKNRLYHDNRDGRFSLWVDSRDGKGVLLEYDVATHQDKILRTQSGLNNPLSWLNDQYLVYRIHTDQETADYILNLEGGEPRKISDVTNSRGLDQWYYY